jgi:hypothetical protein
VFNKDEKEEEPKQRTSHTRPKKVTSKSREEGEKNTGK